MPIDKETLEKLYLKFNDRRYVHPYPLEFLYNYKNPQEMEVVGLIAASLAYGQVRQILKSVSFVLKNLGKNPSSFLKFSSENELENIFSSFKHRFTTGSELAKFLSNIGKVLKKYGSLNECFLNSFKQEKDIIPSLLHFIKELRLGDYTCYNSLLPIPSGKCAYKRMNLYLRWMIRKDNIDCGCWQGILPKNLVIPLDIHMHRISALYGFTQRKQADIKTALEVTEAFKKYAPDDPVKYDFALTRLGIQSNNLINPSALNYFNS